MIIAIETGMEEIKQILEGAGHKVVTLYGHHGAIDAMVYKEEQVFSRQSFPENFSGNHRGIFMVCARGLSAEEVLYAVENRCYGTIF